MKTPEKNRNEQTNSGAWTISLHTQAPQIYQHCRMKSKIGD